MSQDGIAPSQQAVQPRQLFSAGSLSTSTIPTSTVPILAQSISALAAASSSLITHAAFSTVTEEIHFDDPCTAPLPAGGIIQINDTLTLFLSEGVSYVAQCGNQTIFKGIHSDNSTVLHGSEPFYASLSPQVYALATATVISYILVVLIFITPRTFYIGGPGGGTGAVGTGAGFRTFLPGTSGRNPSVIGIGRRPLLQKIAALTVAVSLTIATNETFRVAKEQYYGGFTEAKTLVEDVVGGLGIRIIRVISDTFLWLAQVQTLIRLFPRHKEKVTIKWLGFGLVLCDTVFSILENFFSQSYRGKPGDFKDAIPALSYLFELSIGLIYASCVLYYALSKRRFAFWHAKMRNVCLVALLSIIAVLIPVVFFITDLAQPDIASWGEYIRWVGAAAASVVVWEWVERIEALERDEKKDGILGREVFDGDEMLDFTPSDDGHDHNRNSGTDQQNQKKSSQYWKNVRDLHIDIQPKTILMRKWKKTKAKDTADDNISKVDGGTAKADTNQITRPPNAVTPISRSDTNSAASTVYAVRYHDPFSPSPAIPEDRAVDERRQSVPINVPPAISDESTLTNSTGTTLDAQRRSSQVDSSQGVSTGRQMWQGVANPFKRKRTEPPAEVAAQIAESNSRRSPIDGRLNLRRRFNAFAAKRKGGLNGHASKNKTPLAVTVIPAQPRASQANIEGDNETEVSDDTDAAHSDGQSETGEVEQGPESSVASPNLATLPVTVIPAPVRGGRTWSPDDVIRQKTTHPSPDRAAQTIDGGQIPQSRSITPAVRDVPPAVHTQRGALTIAESPGRTREPHTPSGGIRARINRSSTLSSITNRMSDVTPATTLNIPGPTPTRTFSDTTKPPGTPSKNGNSERSDPG